MNKLKYFILGLLTLTSCAGINPSRDSEFRFHMGDVVEYRSPIIAWTSIGIVELCPEVSHYENCTVTMRDKYGTLDTYIVSTKDLILIERRP